MNLAVAKLIVHVSVMWAFKTYKVNTAGAFRGRKHSKVKYLIKIIPKKGM